MTAGVAPHVAVAASGGRDSTALLHCTARAAAALGVDVVALHVHHGLMPDADAWLRQVRAQARRWGADFASRRLAGGPPQGASVEAWARRGRYAALAEMAHETGCTLVLLAHHRRDQAETVLLQALRGGGAAALAAMPKKTLRDGIVFARPWLSLPREAVEAYVRRHRLGYVDDPSNAAPVLARARLRALWPALQAAFPQAETTLAHTAQRLADERALLDELAAGDLGAAGGQALEVASLGALTLARRRQLLRGWLRGALLLPVPETLVRRLADELPGAVHARWPAPGGELRLRRGRLQWQAAAAPVPGSRQPPA